MIDTSLPPPNCIVCDNPVRDKPLWLPDPAQKIASYPCPQCGDFRLRWIDQSYMPAELENDPEKRLIASHHIRKITRTPGEPPPLITVEIVRRMLEQGLPKPAEQAANVILWIGDSTRNGQSMDVMPEADLAVVGSHDGEAFRWVLNHLKDEGFISFGGKGRAKEFQVRGERTVRFEVVGCTLTMKGWERYEELRRSAADSRLAFMAMEFDNPVLDRMFKEVFKPAVAATGFELRRIDERPPAGSIDNRLRVEIRRSRFVVVDLTNDNSGAYWEAGYAEGVGRKVFFTCLEADDQKPHFDTRQQYIVFWRPEEPGDAAQHLKDVIRATIPDAKMEDVPSN
jgi:hypothetical protein